MEKILTISIAAYNVEKYLKEALDSLIIENYMSEIEVLIVNDGSTDGTRDIALDYQKKYPETFILLDKQNGGWGSTVNLALQNAKGKYFKLLDGDDYFKNLEEFVKLLKKTDADLIYNKYVSFYDDSEKIIFSEYKKDDLLEQELKINCDNFKENLYMPSCTFKTSLLKDKIKLTEKCFYTDVEYVINAFLTVKTIYFTSTYVYWYRLGRVGQSASVEGCRKHYKEHLKVLLKLLKLYSNLNDCDYKKIISTRIKELVDMQYSMFLMLDTNLENAKLMKKYDLYIKKKYPEFYKNNKKRIKAFRIFGVKSYKFIVY